MNVKNDNSSVSTEEFAALDDAALLSWRAEARAELERLAPQKRGGLLELNTPFRQAMAAGVGGFALLAGVGLLFVRNRRKEQ